MYIQQVIQKNFKQLLKVKEVLILILFLKATSAICEEYSIFNVQNVKFGQYGYSKGKEHSKWAISVYKYINCFSDLNHCPSQANRGGNIICFENELLHDIMKDAVVDIDSC